MTPAELKAWRHQHGHTQRSLADALGVTVTTISRWESGRAEPPPYLGKALQALAPS